MLDTNSVSLAVWLFIGDKVIFRVDANTVQLVLPLKWQFDWCVSEYDNCI